MRKCQFFRKKNASSYKMKIIFSFLFFFLLFLIPSQVLALSCDYDFGEEGMDELSGQVRGGKLNCNFEIGHFIWWETFDQTCKFIYGDDKKGVLVLDPNKENPGGFNLIEHIKSKNACPKYVWANVKEIYNATYYTPTALYFANTEDQSNKILKSLPKGVWQQGFESSLKEEIHNKDCQYYTTNLDADIKWLKEAVEKSEKVKCNEYNEKTNDFPAEIKRSCQDYYNTLQNISKETLTELDQYVKRGCLSKDSVEYNNYKKVLEDYKKKGEELQYKFETGGKELEDLNIPNGTQSCEGIFKVDANGNFEENSFGWLLQKMLNYVKIAGPILVILFTMFEFAKAIIISDEEAMKKAQSRLVIRLVAVLALFLLPFLVEQALKLINGLSNPTCFFK